MPVISRFSCAVGLFLLLAGLCSCAGGNAPERVVLGDERTEEYLPLLEEGRIAIFSNHSGIVGDIVDGVPSRIEPTEESVLEPFLPPSSPRLGKHILDLLIEKGVNVTAIFSPEHGFRGDADAGEHVGSSVDPRTGVPILSLYEDGRLRPSDESMGMFDILVVDIQDVGLRYYTYYVTMQRLLDACSEFGKKVVLLDRPNPNGFYVDGPVLDMGLRSGVGSLPITTVHGMTLGEMAGMMNGEGWLTDGRTCDLTVVPCLGYTHATRYSLILPPSPNLKDMKSVYLYASTCYFEGTKVSLGRGTSHPFEMYGHPDMTLQPYTFTPESVDGAKNPPLLGRECHGVDLTGKPLREIWDEGINLGYVIDAYSNLTASGSEDGGESFFLGNGFFNLLSGRLSIREDILSGRTASQIKASWADDVASFKERRKKYLLYPEE